LAAASIWVGGLTHFVAGMAAVRRLPEPARTRLTAVLIPRFSRIALLSVAGLALSGLVAGVLRIGAWSDLIATGYGGALLAKVILAAVMISLGAVNLLVMTPGMRRGGSQPGGAPGMVAFFRTMIRGEVALGILAFAATGILTSLPPTRAPSTPAALTLTGRAEDLKVVLEISPGRVGWNTFVVSLTSGGDPVTAASAVDIDFTPTNAGVSTSRASLAPLGDGRYRAEGAYLSLLDRWTMRVAVRRDRMFDAIVDLTLDLNPS
jgi:copper transport protein